MSTQKAVFPSKSDEYYLQRALLKGLVPYGCSEETKLELVQQLRRQDERDAGYFTGDDLNIDNAPDSDDDLDLW